MIEDSDSKMKSYHSSYYAVKNIQVSKRLDFIAESVAAIEKSEADFRKRLNLLDKISVPSRKKQLRNTQISSEEMNMESLPRIGSTRNP